MKLFNSSTKKIVNLTKDNIKIYNCGPTVYNHIHIGNARPLVVFDVLYRYLIHIGKNVEYVLNITDIDDKIINRAIEEQKTEKEVSEYYFQEYLKIKKQLNTLEMFNPKVSDNIYGIIDFIGKLVEKEFAYELNGDVYFDTSKIKEYGCISNNKTSDLQVGKRINSVSDKKNQNDFILWKKTNRGIKWNSKWSEGRPGWHTECVYLINKFLAESIDIHGGGMDLKFPHHENENAQNVALNNKNLADIWLHVGMININNEKMSKSLNNFILVKDILKKYDYKVLRWFFYQTSYSNPLNYSDEIMNNMDLEISKIEKQLNQSKSMFVLNNVNIEYTEDLNLEFKEMLENNLNITNAITSILQSLKKLNKLVRDKSFEIAQKEYVKIINELNILGIEFEDKFDPQIISLLEEYKAYLSNKEYDKADKVRFILIEKGIL